MARQPVRTVRDRILRRGRGRFAARAARDGVGRGGAAEAGGGFLVQPQPSRSRQAEGETRASGAEQPRGRAVAVAQFRAAPGSQTAAAAAQGQAPGPHKSTPQTRAPQQRLNRKDNNRRNNNRKNTPQQQDRQATSPAAPGTNSRPGGTPQAAGVPSNVLNDLLQQFLDGLAKLIPAPPGQQTARQSQPGTRQVAPAQPGKQRYRQGVPRKRGTAPARPGEQARCGKDGCLTIVSPPKKPKPQRPKVRSLDNRKVVDSAEKELQKWNEANEQRRREMRQQYADAHNGPGSSIVDWCARFVTYVYAQAGVPLPEMQKDQWDQSPTGFQLVSAGATWAKGKPGWWHPGTKGVQAGDIVIYNGENHTGVVSRVYEDGSFDTIEGNTGGGPASQSDITKVHHSAGGNGIEGRIRPPANK